MNQCLFVFGPESSGTRLVTEMCIAGGAKGEHYHVQTWDTYEPNMDESPYIVWRRSFPHAKSWPDIEVMNLRMSKLGYATKALVTTRSWYPSIPSQIAMQHTSVPHESRENLIKALPYILNSLLSLKIDYELISYESLICDKEQTINGINVFTHLNIPIDFQINNENSKWKK